MSVSHSVESNAEMPTPAPQRRQAWSPAGASPEDIARAEHCKAWLVTARCRLTEASYTQFRELLRQVVEVRRQMVPESLLDKLADLLQAADFPEGAASCAAWMKEFLPVLPAGELRQSWNRRLSCRFPNFIQASPEVVRQLAYDGQDEQKAKTQEAERHSMKREASTLKDLRSEESSSRSAKRRLAVRERSEQPLELHIHGSSLAEDVMPPQQEPPQEPELSIPETTLRADVNQCSRPGVIPIPAFARTSSATLAVAEVVDSFPAPEEAGVENIAVEEGMQPDSPPRGVATRALPSTFKQANGWLRKPWSPAKSRLEATLAALVPTPEDPQPDMVPQRDAEEHEPLLGPGQTHHHRSEELPAQQQALQAQEGDDEGRQELRPTVDVENAADKAEEPQQNLEVVQPAPQEAPPSSVVAKPLAEVGAGAAALTSPEKRAKALPLCVVCKYPPLKPKVAAMCGHFACADCWSSWIVLKFECPVCRMKVRPNNLIRIRGWHEDG